MKRNNKKSYVKKSLNVIISELKKEWKIDDVFKRGAFFISKPDSLLNIKEIITDKK